MVLFLGDPFQRTNTEAVLRALEGTESMAFSRVSFRDRSCRDSKHHGWPLKVFQKWERLDLRMAICCGMFEGIDNDEDDVLKQRDWIIRGSQASSPCIHLNETSIQPPDGQVGNRKRRKRIISCPDWDEDSISRLLNSCRNFRSRHEEKLGQIVTWNIEIHLSVLVGDKIGGFCVHDMNFLPLKKPPIAILKKCSGGRCECKSWLEEAWLKGCWKEG